MAQFVEVQCCNQECGRVFRMSKGEYQRHLKRGYQNKFCSRKCDAAYKKAHPHKTITQGMREWTGSEANRVHAQGLAKAVAEERRSTTKGWKEFLRRARGKKGKECSLTIEDLKEVWANQDGRCPYTGWKLILPDPKMKKTPRTASMDRLDNAKGYVAGNIQFVSVMANLAKCDFSEEEMREFCKAIAENSRI